MWNLKKKLRFALIVFIGSVFFGITLNVAAFLLPDSAIHPHVLASAESFRRDGGFPQLVYDYSGTTLDANSDAWMLLMSDYNEDNGLIDKALSGYYNVYPSRPSGLTGITNIQMVDIEEPTKVYSYPRYWHGWIFFLRLLLCFFDYSGIRMVNMFLQYILLITCFILFEKKKLLNYSVAFFVALMVLVPIASAICFEYSFIYYIFMLAILGMLAFHQKIKDSIGYATYFFVVGIITSYLDFLTYPILSIGMPLTLLMLIEKDIPLKDKVRKIIIYSLAWGIGYGGMWAAKWVAATLLTDHNVILEAWKQIIFRTSHQTGSGPNASDLVPITYAETVKRNLRVFLLKRPYLLLFFAGSAFYARGIVQTLAKDGLLKIVKTILPFTLIAAMPFVWWFILMNHSYIHCHFTYRAISVSVFALLCALGACKLDSTTPQV